MDKIIDGICVCFGTKQATKKVKSKANCEVSVPNYGTAQQNKTQLEYNPEVKEDKFAERRERLATRAMQMCHESLTKAGKTIRKEMLITNTLKYIESKTAFSGIDTKLLKKIYKLTYKKKASSINF